MKTFFLFFNLIIVSIILVYTTGCFYSYFYPLKYENEIIEVSDKYNVEPELIASMINVESSYREKIISNKGAVGLMQIMPKTAEWVAKKLNKKFSIEFLYNPKYNIEIGSYYLSYLINYFQDVNTGICAYNAGIGNVEKWLKDVEFSDNGKILKKIPFIETKKYLSRVIKNYHYYKNRFK